MVLLKSLLGSLLILQYWTSANGLACVNHLNQKGTCRHVLTCKPLLRLFNTYAEKTVGFLQRSRCPHTTNERIVCCPHTKLDKIKTSDYGFLYPPDCGMPKYPGKRLVNAVRAQLGAWPWMALLIYHPIGNSDKPRYLCGGSLISTRHVLTAAHCITNEVDPYLVRLGEFTIDDDQDDATPIDFSIEKRIIHPDYSNTTFVNDIAILKLDRDQKATNLIIPVCLPVLQNVQQTDLSDKNAFTAGWGTVFELGPISSTLLQIQSRVIDNVDCRKAYSKFGAIIDDRVLCGNFGVNNSGVCQGDSGGPMMIAVDKAWYHIGVVSIGVRCADNNYPSIYTKTQSFLEFIENNLD